MAKRAPATPKQVALLYQLAARAGGLDIVSCCRLLGVARPDQLSMAQAGALIDDDFSYRANMAEARRLGLE